ncbi:cyclin-I [Ditylenchus destructor]|uniref:Cyclin-I n=1 Tax=Ditylenchus destructor TaxID=166010 RepID=A0AAD4NK95_9BILA|nr:cyclin-I [Ditylenchus destructor]
MGDGVHTLSSVLLQSLLRKERDVKLGSRSLPPTEEAGSSHNTDCITSELRDKQVQWLVSMGRRLDLGISTVGLAVGILDRMLRVVLVRSKYVNCVAVTSLYLAVKLHEDDYAFNDTISEDEYDEDVNLTAARLLSQLGVAYSVQELNRMERSILRVLNWDLMLPTCDRFLEAMLIVIGAPHLAQSAELISQWEAIMASSELVSNYLPSTLALSLLSLMLQSTSSEWNRITQSLKEIFKVEDETFAECMPRMKEVVRYARCRDTTGLLIPSAVANNHGFMDEVQTKRSRKRSRQFSISSLGEERDGMLDENSFGKNVVGFPAGKGVGTGIMQSDLDRDVMHVLYNILNRTQQD